MNGNIKIWFCEKSVLFRRNKGKNISHFLYFVFISLLHAERSKTFFYMFCDGWISPYKNCLISNVILLQFLDDHRFEFQLRC